MAPLGSICLVVTAAILLVHCSGRETSLVRDKIRQVRTAPQPPQGQCVHINRGGTSGVHYYVCCNNCDEGGGNPTCDRVTYQGASTGNYCGHCGTDMGNGKLKKYFNCGGCTGQGQVQETCSKEYSWVFPGTCWVYSYCFQNRCQKGFSQGDGQRARRNIDDEPFCGDDTCDPGETINNCPFDCCPVKYPATCGRFNSTCPPVCCSEAGCCRVSGSPTIKREGLVALTVLSMMAYVLS